MIVYFTKGTRSAGSSRHRAFFWSDVLSERGFETFVAIPPVFDRTRSRFRARWEYVRRMFSLRSSDVVVLQTTIFNRLFIGLMFIVSIVRRPRIVFDFDDAIYTDVPKTTRLLVLLSDRVVVASHRLAEWTGLRGREVLVMPNLINWERSLPYQTAYDRSSPLVLGWIGGGFGLGLENLRILKPVFERLIQDNIAFRFRLIGALGKEETYRFVQSIDGLDAEVIDRLAWDVPGEIQKANASFDIGLCPLIDNEINWARCSLKILDYMAAGLPVVASDIGENRYFIENNNSGFLAKSTDDWVSALKALLHDGAKRRRIGVAAAKRIQIHYSYESQFQTYVEFLTSGDLKGRGVESTR